MLNTSNITGILNSKDIQENANNIKEGLNGAEKAVGNAVKGVAGDLGEGVDAIGGKLKEMKTKGLGVWNFLKKAGVMLGTAFGGVVGLVVGGVIAASTLPVSLPVLGAIAGGLFVGGAVAALIDNIRDENVKGPLNVFKHTLKDIGSSMLMAVPTLLKYVFHPEKAGEDVQKFIDKADKVKDGVQKRLEDIQKIVKDTANNIADKTEKAVADLQKQVSTLQKQFNDLHANTIKTLREKTRENLDALDTSKKNVFNSIKELKTVGTQKLTEAGNKALSEALENIEKKIEDDELNRTFEALNKSFSKEPTKSVQTNEKNIFKKDIEGNQNSGKVPNEDKEQDLLDISNISNIEKEVEPLAQSGVHDFKKINNAMEPKAHEVIKAEEIQPKQTAEHKPEVQLGNVLEQLKSTDLNGLENAARKKVSSCYKDEEAQYNNIIREVKRLKVFEAAIKDARDGARTIDTLHGIKRDALDAIENLKKDKFVQLQNIKFDALKSSINELKTDDKDPRQYKMSVEIGNYKSYNPLSWNYERTVNCSLSLNGDMIELALA